MRQTFVRSVLKKIMVMLSLLPGMTQAQYERDYTPIHQSLRSASLFLIDPLKEKERSLKENTILTGKEAEAFYSQMLFFKDRILQSGQLYLNNGINSYLDSVAARLLLSEPRLQNKIKIYLTRFTQSNAFCFPDGSIFINIGMIVSVQNETELAFILAHEIGHYAEQHSIKDLKKLTMIQSEETRGPSDHYSDKFRSLRFSRASELEADSWALQLLAQAGYDASLAPAALSRLKKESSLAGSIDPEKIFNSQNFKVDTSWYNVAILAKNKVRYQKEDKDPIASGKMDDLFSTHPELDKRIEALNLIIPTLRLKKEISLPIRQSLTSLNALAAFERIENNYLEQDYVNAVIGAIHALENYPDNAYLHGVISKSLYWLSYYKEIYEGSLVMWGDENENGADFYKVYSFINQMGLKDVKKLAYTYSALQGEKHAEDETLQFYQALSTDNYLGLNAAKNQYRDYIQKYPQGQFSAITKIKLQ